MGSFEIVHLDQGTPEWHEFRRNHIGASDAPIIMNASPWKTPYKLWQEKLGIAENGYTSAAMQRGIDLEPKARAKYIELTGIEVEPVVLKSKKHPFMSASLDGLSKDGKRVVEIKCAGKQDHALALNGIIPEKYKYQLIQEGVLTEVDQVDYFSYRDDDDCVIVPFFLNDVSEEAAALIEREKEFWKCIQNLEEPDLLTQDFVDKDDVEWNLTVGEYIHAKQQLKRYEVDEKRFRELLIQMADGNNSHGSGIVLTKHLRKGSIEYGQIPELKGIDIEKYRKPPTSYWKIKEG